MVSAPPAAEADAARLAVPEEQAASAPAPVSARPPASSRRRERDDWETMW